MEPSVLLTSLQQFYDNKKIEWDVLLIGGNNVPPYEKTTEYCIRVSNCQTTTGYIVKRHYYDVLIKNFRESAQGLLQSPNNKQQYALDRKKKTGLSKTIGVKKQQTKHAC